MYYRLNLIVPTTHATIQQGRFTEWAANRPVVLESRKWLKRADPKKQWVGLGAKGQSNDQGDLTSFPGAPGISPCQAGDRVVVFVGVPIPDAPQPTPPVVTITVVFARNQLGQSNSSSPFLTSLATVNGSPLKCTFTGAPKAVTDNELGLYWYALNLTDELVKLSDRIGRFEFNVGATIQESEGAVSEFAHDPEMDVGSDGSGAQQESSGSRKRPAAKPSKR